MQVYAVLYSGEGNFLMGRKPKLGYFFHDSSDGEIYPKGVSLNGAEKPALPGGKLEGEDIEAGAQKEFQEECGEKISFSSSSLTINGQKYELKATDTEKSSCDKYYAAFFKFADKDLKEIFNLILNTNLRQAKNAVEKICNKEITVYKDIIKEYTYCPPDNELDTAEIWNLKGNKEEIDKLEKDNATGWFYEILMYLKQKLIGC